MFHFAYELLMVVELGGTVEVSEETIQRAKGYQGTKGEWRNADMITL